MVLVGGISVVKGAMAAVLSTVVWLLGGYDKFIEALLLAMTLDIIMGVAHAYMDGVLNSKKMRLGIMRKSLYFVVVSLAVLLDRTLLNSQPVARTLVISYLVSNEALSILEHAAGLGIPIPKTLLNRLERLREESDSVKEGSGA